MTAIFEIRSRPRGKMLHASGVTPGSHKDALAKWEFLHNCAVDGLLVYDGGSKTCSFCLAYCDSDEGDDCLGCPIHKVTGKLDCVFTPYDGYYESLIAKDVEGAIDASAHMVEFLKSLDPCEGCGNQGSTALFGTLPPGDGLNLCRDACDIGQAKENPRLPSSWDYYTDEELDTIAKEE